VGQGNPRAWRLFWGAAGVAGVGLVGYAVWSRYRQAKREEEARALVAQYLDKLFQAQTDDERAAAAVGLAGAVARDEVSTQDLQRVAGAAIATQIGSIAGALLGNMRMSDIAADYREELAAQRAREQAAAQAAMYPIPAAPGTGGTVVNPPTYTGGAPPAAPAPVQTTAPSAPAISPSTFSAPIVLTPSPVATLTPAAPIPNP
jgi:hypothetical protein